VTETTKVTVPIRPELIQSSEISVFPDYPHPFTARGNGRLNNAFTITSVSLIYTGNKCAWTLEDTALES
jgi:hypothetical protein